MLACIDDRHCEEAQSADEAITKLKPKYTLRKPDAKYRWLVTGGAGFIGSHIVERLLKEGHHVRVLDNFSSGKIENLSFIKDNPQYYARYELIRGGIRDFNTCLTACDGVDYVLHQAALRSVPKSLEEPYEYNAVNIDGTVNLLKASLENKITRFVLASTCAIYGEAKTFPQKETDPNCLISPYALTKLAGEYYCRIFSENYGLETACLRYFNVFGPKQSLEDEYAIVIPKFITCMLEDKNPPIHGTGEQSRDFTYVGNVVDANILAATTPSLREAKQHPSLRGVNNICHCEERSDEAISKRSTFHEVFNVGTGKDSSIIELVDILNKVMHKSIKPTFTPPRPGDVLKAQADISKIGKLLGYKPRISFEEGLNLTVEWFDLQKMENAAL